MRPSARPRLGRRIAGALVAAWTAAGPAAPGPSGADPGEPALCREIAESAPDDPLEALRQAENERWRAARHAAREGRRLLQKTLGGGTSLPTRRLSDELAQAQDRYHEAVHEARVICGCREARGDPYREDCDALFRALQARYGLQPPAP